SCAPNTPTSGKAPKPRWMTRTPRPGSGTWTMSAGRLLRPALFSGPIRHETKKKKRGGKMSEGVQLNGVCADFGDFRAVDHVSVTIKPGEFFSFLGPSGCGKTTILRMVSGFISPSQGEILIGGQNMRGIGPNKRPTVLIFQNLALFPLMPVWEN